MSLFLRVCRAAAFVALTSLRASRGRPHPMRFRPTSRRLSSPGLAPPIDYSLETEMVVHNWVLCVSQPLAEQLAKAREAGPESARSAYADLAGARSCGKFPELRVILQQSLYQSRKRCRLRRARLRGAGQSLRRLGDRLRRFGQPAGVDVQLASAAAFRIFRRTADRCVAAGKRGDSQRSFGDAMFFTEPSSAGAVFHAG